MKIPALEYVMTLSAFYHKFKFVCYAQMGRTLHISQYLTHFKDSYVLPNNQAPTALFITVALCLVKNLNLAVK
jgi:hypothetical protein